MTNMDSHQAKQILEMEVFAEAQKLARQQLFEAWLTCTSGTQARELLWHRAQNVDALTNALRTIRDRGVIERAKKETA